MFFNFLKNCPIKNAPRTIPIPQKQQYKQTFEHPSQDYQGTDILAQADGHY